MGIFKKDEMLLDFKGVQTEDMSSTVPYMNKLNYDAKMLVNHLGPRIGNNAINRKGLVLFNESEQYDLYKLFEKSTTLNNNDNNFSETSPFISSDVYNQLLNKLKSKKQLGGGKKNVSRAREEDRDDDFEDESSTTSSEESESDKKKKKVKKMFKEKSDEVELEEDEEEEFSEMSAGSYVSSSAHTDGTNTNTNTSDDSESESYKSKSITSSTVSVRNHKGSKSYRHNVSDSVNTSDINIISVDE
jgi:hypothetical protein